MPQQACEQRPRLLGIWGFGDWDDVLYRFKGAGGVRSTGVWAQLNALPSGCHEIAVSEAGVWSAPYRFCLVN